MKVWRVSTLALVAVFLMTGIALADQHTPMPGANLWNWLSANVLGAFPVLIGCLSLWYLVKRAFAAFIGFAIFACIVAVFVYAPEVIEAFGIRMGRTLLR